MPSTKWNYPSHFYTKAGTIKKNYIKLLSNQVRVDKIEIYPQFPILFPMFD